MRVPPETQTEDGFVAVDWTVEDYGLVRGMRYHDGRLAGVEIGDGRVRVVVHPVGGGVTTFEFGGEVAFGSTGLASDDIVLDVWAFRLNSGAEPPIALKGAVGAFYGDALYDEDVGAAVQRICAENAGRLLVSFSCACTSEFSILADDMRVAKAGY